MAWFNWFSRNDQSSRADARGGSFGVLTPQQTNASRPMAASGVRPNGVPAQPAAVASAQRLEQRRTERNTKRELLFQVVRESMVRVGVLSSAFKFKVLSLDQRGRSFLVMIELSAEFSGEVEKLAEIESMIAQTARHRYEIVVQAVYWRYFNTSSAPTSVVARPPASAPAPLLGALQAPISRPAPLFGMDGMPSQGAARPTPAPISHSPAYNPGVSRSFPIIGATDAQRAAASAPFIAPRQSDSDELSDDEVAAFRRALAAGAAQGAMAAPTAASATAVKVAAPKPAAPNTLELARSKLLLTGYEDTEMADDDPLPALSGTQYGELR